MSNYFDLQKALAGEKVITASLGDEVTQITSFNLEENVFSVCGVLRGVVCFWNDEGSVNGLTSSPDDLFMAPKMLEGFLNVDSDTCSSFFESKNRANQFAHSDRVACIDLSLFPIGYGILSGRK